MGSHSTEVAHRPAIPVPEDNLRTTCRATRALLLGAGLYLALAGCNSTAPDSRDWKPSDHTNNKGNPSPGQTSGVLKPGQEDTTLVEVTWRQNCMRCHGPRGLGNGPEGRMLRVPSLARAELNDVPDAALRHVIKNGRNKMPSFKTLPPKVVAGLVKYIRGFQRR